MLKKIFNFLVIITISSFVCAQDVLIIDNDYSVSIEYKGINEDIRCSSCDDLFFKLNDHIVSANKTDNIIHYSEDVYNGRFYLKSTSIHFELSNGDFIVFNKPNYHTIELNTASERYTFSKIGKTYILDSSNTPEIRNVFLIAVLLAFNWL